jgi:hypothetical protein
MADHICRGCNNEDWYDMTTSTWVPCEHTCGGK